MSRSVSSAGEHQSDQFINPPILPKRAETFGGFDHNAAALARLLQKFTSSPTNVVASTTITTCSPSTMSTTNTIIDKLACICSKDGQEMTSLENKITSYQVDKQRLDDDQVVDDKQIEDLRIENSNIENPKIISANDTTSPSILVNTVLPMQDPNKMVSQLSTLPLLISQLEHSRNSVDSELSVTIPQSKHEQIIQIVELQHQLNLLLCLFHHQQTLFELMRANCVQDHTKPSTTTNNQTQIASTSASSLGLNTISPSKSLTSTSNTMHHSVTNISALPSTSSNLTTSSLNKKFRAENQLEELRNLHEQFSAEKQSFEKRTKELDKREAQLRQEKEDLVEQRENLYRKLENLQDEFGICILGSGSTASAKLASIQASLNLGTSSTKSDSTVPIDKQTTDDCTKPSSRITRTRLSSGDLQVKQQIPLKLATGNNQLTSCTMMSKSCNNSPNISPNISPSITGTFDILQSNKSSFSSKKSSISSSTATSPKSIKVIRKESNQPIVNSSEDKNEEEIFC